MHLICAEFELIHHDILFCFTLFFLINRFIMQITPTFSSILLLETSQSNTKILRDDFIRHINYKIKQREKLQRVFFLIYFFFLNLLFGNDKN